MVYTIPNDPRDDGDPIVPSDAVPISHHPRADVEASDTLRALQAALASSLSGIAVCDRFRRVVLTNDALDTLFGYEPRELLRRDITTLVPGLSFAATTAADGTGFRKDGSSLLIKVRVTPAAAREPLFIVSVIDLSDRQHFEAINAALSGLATRCIGESSEYLPSTLDEDVTAVADALGIDRCIALMPSSEDPSIRVAWQWSRPSAAAVSDEFEAALALPWTATKVRTEETVCVAALDEVPMPADRESLRDLCAAAYVVLPMPVCGASGALLVSSAVPRTWPEDVVGHLRLLAAILSQGIARVEPRGDGSRPPLRGFGGGRAEGPIVRRDLGSPASQPIVSESYAIRAVIAQAHQVAPTTATVLLLGETGVGKEVFAQLIHNLSPRQRRPMVRISCAAIPSALIESELFGRERGAFTGALSRQIGRFEAANGSTIFLDEIGELPPEIQVKLLRVLQERTIERLGGNQSLKVDVRVIAATNRNLEQAVANSSFREDLFYRLNVFPITVPPLRDRVEDIPSLVWSFIDEFSSAFGKSVDSITKESLAALQRYGWPGNVRELRNAIEREMIVATGPTLSVSAPRPAASMRRAASARLVDVEVEHIRSVLDSCRWRVRGTGGAAERLGVKPTTLESRMARLGIARDRPPAA